MIKNLILLIGSPGVGKTTLAEKLLCQGDFLNSAYILNDEGGNGGTPDQSLLEGKTRLSAMLNGCFGCRDLAQFKTTLSSILADEEIETLFIEPVGFDTGAEMMEVLKSFNLKPFVITLLNQQKISAYNSRHDPLASIVPAQISLSDAILVTHCASVEDETYEFIGQFNKNKSRVSCLDLNEEIDHNLIHAIESSPIILQTLGVTNGFKHNHHHEVNPALIPVSFQLKPEVNYQQVVNALDKHEAINSFYRIKADVLGIRLDKIINQPWQQKEVNSNQNILVIYLTSELELNLDEITVSKKQSSLNTQELLRQNTDITASIAALSSLLAEVPKTALMKNNLPVTNPELHEILNEVRKRPGIPAELNSEAIKLRVEYYLSCLQRFNQSTDNWLLPGADKCKRDLSVGIAWFAKNKPNDLGPELLNQIDKDLLTACFKEGFSSLWQHNDDAKRAIIVAEEFLETLLYLEVFDDFILDIIESLLILAQNENPLRPELVQAWEQVKICVMQKKVLAQSN